MTRERCPVCGATRESDGYCEFCPGNLSREHEHGEPLQVSEPPAAETESESAFLARTMAIIETWSHESRRAGSRIVDGAASDGRFIALTFADGTASIIGE